MTITGFGLRVLAKGLCLGRSEGSACFPWSSPRSCVTPAELLFVAIAVAGDAAERSRKEGQGAGRPDEKPMQSAHSAASISRLKCKTPGDGDTGFGLVLLS